MFGESKGSPLFPLFSAQLRRIGDPVFWAAVAVFDTSGSASHSVYFFVAPHSILGLTQSPPLARTQEKRKEGMTHSPKVPATHLSPGPLQHD